MWRQLFLSIIYIAVLQFKKNSYSEQAVNKSGEPNLIYSVSYPKEGACISREVKVKQTYSKLTSKEVFFYTEINSFSI